MPVPISPLRLAAGAALLCVAAATGLAARTMVPAGWPPPPALPPPHPVVDNYFGTKLSDPYRYFENLADPVVQSFFRKQNAYARAVLAKLEPGRSRLFARIKALDNAGPSVSSVTIVGAFTFYEKRAPGDNDTKLWVRHTGQQDDRVLVDPGKLATNATQHFTIEYFLPSPDGTYVAYGVSEGGSENATLHVVETASGNVLPDAIDRAKYVGASGWLPDGKSFAYMRFPKLAAGQSPNEAELRPVAYIHQLGRDPDKDPAVFGFGVDPALTFAPTDFAVVAISPASDKYAIGIVAHGVQNEQTLYVAPLASLTAGGSIPWKKIADTDDDVTADDISSSTLFLLSHKDAPTYKVIATSLASPDVAHAQMLIAPSSSIVQGISVARDGVYVRSRDGGFGKISRVVLNNDGTPGSTVNDVTLPYPGAVDTLATDPRVDGAVFDLTSWTKSLLYYQVDATGKVADTGLKAPSSIDASGYTSSEENATSADGTKVPISIVMRKDLVRDGSHPAYLEGYGAYGIEIDPGFLGTRFAWLERNGVYAVCHTRGGGWFGEDWHRAGMLATKQHTIDDFVACARYLIAQKYTSPEHLAGEGTSAGGITIGRSITEHPELFAAALDVVGVSDALRSEFSPNGPPNVPEFGSVKDPEQFKALANMDAYQHVQPGTKYPAVMLVTGINDPRVSPWELGKFAARLQSASASGRPIVLRVDYDAGHGFLDSSRTQSEQLLTDQYAFLLWQLGDPLFAHLPARIAPRTHAAFAMR